jgi:proteasome lid subunit RPN8/RPN11
MGLGAIEIAPSHRAELRRAFEAALPRECCGVLMGKADGARSIVCRVVNTSNAVSTTGGFAIPDQEMRRVRRLAARLGLSILAIFHSHPGGSPEPSDGDRAALAHSEWPWVILTQDPSTREMRLSCVIQRE